MDGRTVKMTWYVDRSCKGIFFRITVKTENTIFSKKNEFSPRQDQKVVFLARSLRRGDEIETTMKMKLIPTLAATLGLVFASFAFAEEQKEAKKDEAAAEAKKVPETIVAAAVGNEDFSTLVAAVKAAGLVETLSGEGPFTVFAPTNAAFEKLPKGTVETLLKPENKDKLIGILTYHVVAGKVMAVDVKTMDVKTVQGKEASLKVADGKVTIDKANVVATDIVTGNGVIHVIDTVILPAE